MLGDSITQVRRMAGFQYTSISVLPVRYAGVAYPHPAVWVKQPREATTCNSYAFAA